MLNEIELDIVKDKTILTAAGGNARSQSFRGPLCRFVRINQFVAALSEPVHGNRRVQVVDAFFEKLFQS